MITVTATDARLIKAGDTAFLTPRTLAACWDVWCQPSVLVLDGPENGTYRVQLPDGRAITVHADDVVRKLPAAPRERAPKVRKPLDGCEEVPLW